MALYSRISNHGLQDYRKMIAHRSGVLQIPARWPSVMPQARTVHLQYFRRGGISRGGNVRGIRWTVFPGH